MYELISIILSVIAMLFYSVVYFPQFHVIYTNRSSSGLSLVMLILWCGADSFNLFATIFLNLSIHLVIVNWYHMFMGFFMIVFAFYFKPNKRLANYIIIPSFIIYNFVTGIALTITVPLLKLSTSITIGESIGWFTTIIYVVGRIPQIFLNYKRKSTVGLSMLMYLFTILGNLFYIASVLTYSIDRDYVMSNMPWIVFTVLTFFLDTFVIYQSYHYKNTQLEEC